MEKILLVEDSKPTIDLINTALTQHGYKVNFALDGKEALDLCKKWMPSLILMDILMPEMDGYETCKQLKLNELTKNIPIIFISALSHTFDKVKAFEAGGVDFINKPIETEELLARITTHLTISRLQNELTETNQNLEEKVAQRTAELNILNLQLQSYLNELTEKSQALEESEERYKMLINNILYPVLVSSYDGTILFINDITANFFGVHPSEVNKHKSTDFWTDISERKGFLEELELNGIVKNREIRFSNNKGKNITAILSSSLIKYYGTPAILSVFNDVTRLKQLEQQILITTIETEERERKRFAQELHDGLGPLLSAAKMYLQWLSQTEDKNDIPNLIQKTNLLLDEAYKTSKEISHGLSPHILENFGLIAALKNFAENINISERLSFEMSDIDVANNTAIDQMGRQKNMILYRVLTECINNTLKHAQASKINITFEKSNNDLEINYFDNGSGFEFNGNSMDNKGLGLINMKSRIHAIDGKFIIKSEKNKGTTIKIQIAL